MISDAAMQALGENQLNRISAEIILNIKLEEELGDHKKILNLIMDILSKAYIELDLDSKYMLVPLFVNKKNSNSSYYFFKPEIQKWVYNSYEVLLKKDNLTFENMLKEYHNQTPLSKKYPYIIEGLLEYIKQDKNIKE